jgi:hypothetical protein
LKDLIETETARAAFVAFARKNDLLVEVENPDRRLIARQARMR